MTFTAKEIAHILSGDIEGSSETEVQILSKIEDAEAGSLTFLANPKYTPFIYNTKASIAVVSKAFIPDKSLEITLIRVDNPYDAFTQLLELFNKNETVQTGIQPSALVHHSATIHPKSFVGDCVVIQQNVKIAEDVTLHPQTFIGKNVTIGKGSIIHPGVKIKSETVIGEFCEIHTGSVIGSDGFGFAPQKDGTFKKIPQTGNVIIKDKVSIGANTTIDRATLGATIIGNGVKLDNQIQIAHNVEIGDNTIIAAQTGIAGSTKIGKHCYIGGQVGIVGHITIGDFVQIQAQSGVTSSLPNAKKIQGTPAMDYNSFMKSYIHFKNLSKLEKRISEIEKKINHDR